MAYGRRICENNPKRSKNDPNCLENSRKIVGTKPEHDLKMVLDVLNDTLFFACLFSRWLFSSLAGPFVPSYDILANRHTKTRDRSTATGACNMTSWAHNCRRRRQGIVAKFGKKCFKTFFQRWSRYFSKGGPDDFLKVGHMMFQKNGQLFFQCRC